jgi:2-dehydro-3-deoxyglucarate aldolase/4-hydroxy-2-oxoheptanedioate aldolase
VFDPRNPTLKCRLASGEPLAAFWLALGSVPLVEAAVAAGAEAVILDMQHGLFDRMGLEHAVGAVPPAVPCLVRVEDDSATAIGRALDAGAEGVIVPLVETSEQARAAAAACRYPPKGHRSGGGVRPLRDFKAYVAGADDVAVGVMIETRTGVENAAAIAGAEGVDFVFIGTGDLALSLGTAPGSEAHVRACKTVLDACRKTKMPCGIFTFDAASAATRAAEGYVLTVATNDISATNEAFARAASAFREARGGGGRGVKTKRAGARKAARR